MTASNTPSNNPPRLESVDALRGFDMFWITGGDVWAIATLTAGSWSFSQAGIEQLEHAPWDGFRFYDLIFPLFLFLVGVVTPFSLRKYLGSNHSNKRPASLRILRRTALLFLLGCLYNGLLQFDWENMRYAGVLQRIALCYGFASLLYLFASLRLRIAFTLFTLIGYWLVLRFIPAPGGIAGDLSPAGNLAGYLDRTYLPGKILPEYYGFGDNEGWLSTWPAIVTVLFGSFTGDWLISPKKPSTKWVGLVAAGLLALLLGALLNPIFPIIKNLWTSSFVLWAAGWSLLLLALFYGLIDLLKQYWLGFVWKVIGVNAITIYLLQEVIDFRKPSQFLFGGFARLTGIWNEPILLAGILLVQWGLLYWMYRQRWFLRV